MINFINNYLLYIFTNYIPLIFSFLLLFPLLVYNFWLPKASSVLNNTYYAISAILLYQFVISYFLKDHKLIVISNLFSVNSFNHLYYDYLFNMVFTFLFFIFITIIYVNFKNSIRWWELPLYFFNYSILIIMFSVDNILIFIILYETFSLCVYLLLLSRSKYSLYNLIYVFISFIAFTFMLIGVILLYYVLGNLTFSSLYYLNSNYRGICHIQDNLYLNNSTWGVLLMLLGVTIKIGFFPFNFWIYKIYSKFPTQQLFYFLTLYKFSLLYIFILIIIKSGLTNFYLGNYISMFLLIVMLTNFMGSILLNKQTNLISFMISNVIVHLGIIGLGYFIIFCNNILFIENYKVFNLIWLYIFFYMIILFLMFISYFEIKVNKKLGGLVMYDKLINKYKSGIIIILLWILSSFPPLMLFMLKFYIVLYSIYAGISVTALAILIISTTLVISGYVKVFNYFILRFT